MPPPGYEPFLHTICENPEDDTARLVYADWLAENGDEERAEFIRVQVERSRLRASGGDSEVLRKRDLEMRAAHGVKWQRELPRVRGVNWQRFWRGFVSGATLADWRFYERHADALFAATPVQFLTVSWSFAEAASRFGASRYITRLIGVTVLDSQSGWDTERVCMSLPAGVLQWVEMRLAPGQECSEGTASAIGSTACIRATTRLRIRGTVPDRAAAALRAALGDRVSLVAETIGNGATAPGSPPEGPPA